MAKGKSLNHGTSPEKKTNRVRVASLVTLAALLITGCQLTGKDSPTGQGDVLTGNRVMSQAEYDTKNLNESHTFDGFLYTDALNLQLRFDSNEELENFTNELKSLQNEETSSKLTEKFAGNHISYGDSKISTKRFTELHKEGKAIWVKCYLPDELLTSDIKAFDSEEQFKSDTSDCGAVS